MNTKSTIQRGGAFALANILFTLCLVALLAALLIPKVARAQANYIAPQGLYVDGSTNTVTVGGSNVCVSVVNPSMTNYFNVNGVNGSQANTNQWPKLGITIGRDQGTPSRILGIQQMFNSGAANAGLFTLRWAGSVDASHWQTNPCPLIESITANGTTYVQWSTNYDSGAFPFLTLYSAENTNATTYNTNLWIGSASKPNQ